MNWEQKPIAGIVNEIKQGDFVLPVIQRDFVWEEEKIELLFDSVLKEHCFGSVVAIEESQGKFPLFEYRKFVMNGEENSDSDLESTSIELKRKHFFVIDGQQRLQAFYIGIIGRMGKRELFFDLLSNSNEEYEFDFAESKAQLPSKNEERALTKCLWYKVSDLYTKLDFTRSNAQTSREIIEEYKITDDTEREQIKDNIESFFTNIFSRNTIGIAVIYPNKSKPEESKLAVLELFKRLNNGGTILDNVELMASTLKSLDARMEGFWRKFLSESKDIHLDANNLLKLIFILQDEPQKALVKISKKDTDFALKNKTRIEETIKATRLFLSQAGIIKYFIDDQPSFIPLLLIMYYIFHTNISTEKLCSIWNNLETNRNFLFIQKWLYQSLLNGVFSKGCGWRPETTGFHQLANILKEKKKQDFPYQEIITLYKNRLNKFIEFPQVEDLDYLNKNFLYYIMYENKLRFRKNDTDHIMPRSILEKLNFDPRDINSIKNFQPLDYSTNRGNKNDTPFRKWVYENVENKNGYVELHLIPTDESLWDEEKFKEFSKARGERIIEKFKKKCGYNN